MKGELNFNNLTNYGMLGVMDKHYNKFIKRNSWTQNMDYLWKRWIREK